MVEPQRAWGSFQQPPVGNSQQPQEESLNQENEKPSRSWGDFQTPDTFNTKDVNEEQEGALSWLARNAVSGVARGIEAGLGGAGDIAELGAGLVREHPDWFGGLFFSAAKEMLGLPEFKKNTEKPIQTILPTSKDLKNVTEKLTGDYTKPKTKGEEAFQDYVSDVGSMLGPGRIPGKGIKKAISVLAVPAVSNAVKATAKSLDIPDDKANLLKLATALPLTLLANVNGRKFATNQVSQAQSSIPNNLPVDSVRYEGRLANLEKRLMTHDVGSNLARDQIAGIREDLRSGRTSLGDLFNRYGAINRAKEDAGLFSLTKPAREIAKRNIDMVRHAVKDEIYEVGSAFPNRLKQWNQGMQSLAVVHQSNRLTNFIDKTVKGPYGKIVGTPLLGVFGLSGYAHPLLTSGAAATVGATHKLGQMAYRVWNDPRLRSYYWQALSAATEHNAAAFSKNYNTLQSSYDKYYPGELFPVSNKKEKTEKSKSSRK